MNCYRSKLLAQHKCAQARAGRNPQRSNQERLLRNLFWEMLFQKETGTASEPYRYPLEKNGHGRKQGRCQQIRGPMPTLLNDTNELDEHYHLIRALPQVRPPPNTGRQTR